MNWFHLFQSGGFMMYPLILCSLIVIAIFVERFRYYRSHQSHTDELVKQIPNLTVSGREKELAQVLDQDGGIPAEVLSYAVKNRGDTKTKQILFENAAFNAANDLKNYLSYLNVIITLSPLMGLLGTVIGMIRSFNVLSVASGQPFAVTGGVAEALVCTATGLFVAIIALICHTYLAQQVNLYIEQMERLGTVYFSHREGAA
jgi:biopolymer transport protein ExbB